MNNKATNKRNKRKFKQTRQLVRLALNDGWTQKTIADSCRTQQSVVSSWARGEKQATEEQLKPLLEIYGNKIRRRSFRVYYSYDKECGYTFSKVEGKIIFSYTFTKKKNNNSSKFQKPVSIMRVVIHEQGSGMFRVVYQVRPSLDHEQYLECSIDDGVWFSAITDTMNSKEVIDNIDKYSNKHNKDFVSESITVPFLIRKAMLEHGFFVEGVVDYPSI